VKGKAKTLKDVEALKWNPRGADIQRHWDAHTAGLFVQVYPASGNKAQTGRRSFFVRYTLDGKQSIKKLGEHGSLTLDEARQLAVTVRATAKQGIQPRVTAPATVAEAWRMLTINEHCPYHRYAENTKRDKDALFHTRITFKDVPVLEVRAEHWLSVIDAATARGHTGTAKALKVLCGMFYLNLNALPEYRTLRNPLAGIRVYSAPSKRKEALSLEQVRFMRLSDPVSNAVLQVLKLTGQRISEVLRMRWDRLTEDRWLVGAVGEMKRKDSAHILPLTTGILKAIEPMKEYGNQWIFPGRDGPLNDSTFSGHLSSAYRGVSAHVLRHTFASLCADNDIDPVGVAHVLHHVLPGMTAKVYTHSQHLEKKRAVLEAYERLLTQSTEAR
jgi:integrase